MMAADLDLPALLARLETHKDVAACLGNAHTALLVHDAAAAICTLQAQRDTAIAQLAECYRLTGADPDGDEDWRLAPYAVAEVTRIRQEHDAAEAQRDQAVQLLSAMVTVYTDPTSAAHDGATTTAAAKAFLAGVDHTED